MKGTVQGIQSIIMEYLCTIIDGNWIHHSDRFEMSYVVYQGLTQCCRSIILQKTN